MPAFVGDYQAAAGPRRVEASAKAKAPAPAPAPVVDPASRMLQNLKKSLSQRK